MDKSEVAANLQYAGEYRAQLEEAQRTGICVFCKETFRPRILRELDDWSIVFNEFPTKDREGKPPQYHFLFVRTVHANTESLSAGDWCAMGALLDWAKREYKFDGGGFCLRDGNPVICGKTVLHDHGHYIVPRRVEDPPGSGKFRTIPVDFPVG